jgi:hypothetical protein
LIISVDVEACGAMRAQVVGKTRSPEKSVAVTPTTGAQPLFETGPIARIARSVDGGSHAVRENQVDSRPVDPGAGHAIARPNTIAQNCTKDSLTEPKDESPTIVQLWDRIEHRATCGLPHKSSKIF